MFGLGKKIAAGAFKEIQGANGENTDILEALIAAGALAAAGDGDIGSSEKAKVLTLVQRHKRIASIYKPADVEKMVDVMFKNAESSDGRQQLARELGELKTVPNGKDLCVDAYLLAKEVCMDAAGAIEDKEAAQLARIATVLAVNPADIMEF